MIIKFDDVMAWSRIVIMFRKAANFLLTSQYNIARHLYNEMAIFSLKK